MDSFGDSVADHLGAQVGEWELGETDDPTKLVHGDVGAINESVEHLKRFDTAFEETADGLKKIDTAHWQGPAAEAFRTHYHEYPRQWLDASDACHEAAAALEGYAHTVQWAQGQAEEAIRLYNQAKHDSERARQAYNTAVDAYNERLASYHAAMGSGADAGPIPQRPGEFHDPGIADRAHAQEILDNARRQRDDAGERAEAAVNAATARAPAEPRFTERMLDNAHDLALSAGIGEEHLLGGALIPNVALAVGTDGAGVAESLGERAAVDVGERAAVDIGEQAVQADRLGAAVDHTIDLSAMTDTPVWRDSAEPLYRADNRDPSEIFRDGFQPKDPTNVDLRTFVQTNNPSAFVSTSTDAELYRQWGAQYRYDIEAPGGIDVNKTLGPHLFENEKEIAFPGGVNSRFIKGANRVNTDGSLGEWITNPGFNPR